MNGAQRKVTVMLPVELIDKALASSGEGLTPTLRRGLELVSSQTTYKKLLDLKGAYPKGLGLDLKTLRKDRETK